MTIADQFSAKLSESGLNINELARLTGVPYSDLADIQAGVNLDPNISLMQKIATGLNIQVQDLLPGPQSMGSVSLRYSYVQAKRVLELFGHPVKLPKPTGDIHWRKLSAETATAPYRDFPCPFSPSQACNKIRKANPNPLIGDCTLGVTGNSNPTGWIVCPQRFLQDQLIFKEAASLFKTPLHDFKVTGEIKIGEVGRVDYLIFDENSGSINDAVAIEIQSMGTNSSGPIWNARVDYVAGRLKAEYPGPAANVKDSSKKILVQLLHKGAQITRWGCKYLLVIQDLFLEHLESAYNINAHFHASRIQDPIHIHAYTLKENSTTGTYYIEISKRISTDMLGLSMALISNPKIDYIEFPEIAEKLLERITAGSYQTIHIP